MGIKEFFDYKKRKNLYMFGAVVLSVNSIVWTRDLISPFLSFKIFGTIDLRTVVGAAMLFGTYLFYNRKLG